MNKKKMSQAAPSIQKQKLDDLMSSWRKTCRTIEFPKPGTREHMEWFPEMYQKKSA